MLESEIKIRVRYGEVDRMGYLHHGNYPLYFEEGRTDLIRKFGLSYREMEDRGILLPVRDLQINYKIPILYDQVVRVITRIEKQPSIKLQFSYTILGDDAIEHCTGSTTLVFVDAQTRKPIRVPEFFSELIKEYW